MTRGEKRELFWRVLLVVSLAVFFTRFWVEVIEGISGAPRFERVGPISEMLFYEGILAALSLGPAYLIVSPSVRSQLRSLLRRGGQGEGGKARLPATNRLVSGLAASWLGSFVIRIALAGSDISSVALEAISLLWILVCYAWILSPRFHPAPNSNSPGGA